jgi:hypothetical protein
MGSAWIDLLLKSLMYLILIFVLPVAFSFIEVTKLEVEWIKFFKKIDPIQWRQMTSVKYFGLLLGPGLRPGYRLIQFVFENVLENNEFGTLTKRLRFAYLKLFLVLALFLMFATFVFGIFLGVGFMGHSL